jgi:hypothetical protein
VDDAPALSQLSLAEIDVSLLEELLSPVGKPGTALIFTLCRTTGSPPRRRTGRQRVGSSRRYCTIPTLASSKHTA